MLPRTSPAPALLAAAAALVGTVLSLEARAAETTSRGVDDFGAYDSARGRGERVESKQNMAAELRFGRYAPSVDEEFQNAHPFKDTFGTSTRYAFGFEIDWQALRIPYLGTLGPGGGLAYTKLTGSSTITRTGEPAEEDSSLVIVPMSLLAVLRADVIARETIIPVVPYAKAGVGAAFWSVSNGGGTARTNGVAGSGLSYGPQFALGGMLLLDAFDKTSAKGLDNELGINNTYVFFEWYLSKLNGFGSGGQMQVGTNSWAAGLAFEL